ncbi:MAG: M90 family metallopeptidase [Polyangiaceae bacterium]
MFGFLRRHHREGVKKQPFPDAWLKVLSKNVPMYAKLSAEDQTELRGHIQVLIDEKTFEGCGGLEISDEIKVTIAAQASMLLLHRETDYYPELETILVYPHTFMAKTKRVEGGVVIEGESARLGESWSRGVVVLAWDNVLAGARDMYDGHNVVLHEFAHQLDTEDGVADGAPVLPKGSMYGPWARVLGSEFEQLVRDEHAHRRSVMDFYGATDPAEFFAVITETFFEKPRQLKAKHPELYEQLKAYYQQDPAARMTPAGQG